MSVRNEARRLAALRAAEILDTPPSEEFDALCRSMASAFDVPMARVSLVDRDREWHKGAYGAEAGEAPRARSLCNHVISQADIFVSEDVGSDPRLAEITGDGAHDGIRFYAGAPILASGRHRIGAVCVMDGRRKRFGEAQLALLRDYARIAGALIEGHASARQKRRERARLNRQLSKLALQGRDLARRDKMLLQTERMAQLGGWEWDLVRKRLHLSDGIYRLMGIERPSREVPDEVLRQWPARSRTLLRNAIARARRTGEPFDIELEFGTGSGERRWGRLMGEVEVENGRARRIFGTFQDVTQARTLNRKLWAMANCDDLTGLAKRKRFTELFDAALAETAEAGGDLGLLIIDLDHFKHINDTLGHRAGDAMLCMTAERLRDCAGPDAAVARLGGDEFAVLLRGVSDHQALLDAARTVVRALAEPIEFEGERMGPGASIGCALAPADGTSIDVLMQNADMALYRAKLKGRGEACLFQSGMREAVQRRVTQVANFRTALEGGQIVPFYQPQMRLQDNSISGFEALARWRKPDGRVATPHEFRHALEDAEACVRLGVAVLEQVAADIRVWTEDGHAPGRIAVNATSPELVRGDYPQRVRRIFEGAGVPLHLLTIEVTENVFLGTSAGRVERALRALREMGAAIALDDFGTGFASLSHLKTYPVDKIKIDRSFIEGLGQGAEDQAIVTAIMHLARSLGIRTIAEGVETTEQLSFLRVMACDGMQGFLLGHPAPACEVPAFLGAEPVSLIA